MSVATNQLAAAPARPSRAALFWASTIGKKALMALTGIILSLFVLAHLLGNLQIYLGKDSTGAYLINKYAEFLHKNTGVLWIARVVLLASVLVHAIAGVQLYLAKQQARPIAYQTKVNQYSSAASRTMIWSGLAILAFVIYHLLHFTTGTAHPDFVPLDVMHNATVGFASVGASLAYVIAMVGVGFHLWHGLYSLFGSLGFSHPRYTPIIRAAAAVIGTFVALLNLSMPLAVLTGVLKG